MQSKGRLIIWIQFPNYLWHYLIFYGVEKRNNQPRATKNNKNENSVLFLELAWVYKKFEHEKKERKHKNVSQPVVRTEMALGVSTRLVLDVLKRVKNGEFA